jgi:hypothetical protein
MIKLNNYLTNKSQKISKNLSTWNNDKILIGICILLVNLGSKYLIEDLGKVGQQILKYKLIRRLTIFAIIYLGTRDIFISLVLTILFILIKDFLINPESKFNIVPKKVKEKVDEVADKTISKEEYNTALKVVKGFERENSNNYDMLLNDGRINKLIEIDEKNNDVDGKIKIIPSAKAV